MWWCFRSLGYMYIEGKVEKQDKFLRRMSGLMRLYAAIIITPGSPHSLDQGWQWLSQVLSLEPRPHITATLVYDFLEVAGHALIKAYGKQFIKLLQTFIQKYMPKLKAASVAGDGGPQSRLETFLEKVLRTGQIKPPEGLLTSMRF